MKLKESGLISYQELCGMFVEVFDMDPTDMDPDLTMDDVDSWDSISHIDLIIRLEERTGIKLKPAEIVILTSVRSILERFSVYESFGPSETQENRRFHAT